jgi:hypothetical protein
VDYGGGYLGDPRGRADAIADSVRGDDHVATDFITEISLSDAVKNSSAGNYSTRAQEELSHDLTVNAIESAPTAGDAWAAVRNARSFLTKQGEPYAYQTGLKKARTIGSSATWLGGLSSLAAIHPAIAALSLVPQGFFTEGAAKLGLGPERTKTNRFFDAMRGDYFLSGSTLDRVNNSLWDLILPEEIWENDN